MIRCKLKEKVGFHMRDKVKYMPGDIMEVGNIKELGGAADKFEILDPVPEATKLEKSAIALKMVHRGGGRFNVVNIETDEAINDNYLTKKEAEEIITGTIEKKQTLKRRRETKNVGSSKVMG